MTQKKKDGRKSENDTCCLQQENINRPPKAALTFKTTERLKCLATLDPKKITPKYRPPYVSFFFNFI